MDAYSYCPGGCGKKIKFCCGVEVIPDIEKLDRMLEAEQRRACLDHIAKMPAKLRDRPCVLAKKAEAHLQAEDHEGAIAAYREILAKQPNNPVALSMLAPEEMSAGRIAEGMDLLQSAIAALADAPEGAPTYGAVLIGLTNCARILGDNRYIWAARACLRLLADVAEDSGADHVLNSIDGDRSVPLVWKQDPQVPPLPPESPFKAEWDEIGGLVAMGRWRESAGRYQGLAQKHPKSPEVWRALAATRAFLADLEGAADALRTYAGLDIPADEAVEAQLSVMASTPPPENDNIDVLRVTRPFGDFEALFARISADNRFLKMRVNRERFADDEPAPREAFAVLDRPALDSAENLTRESIPEVIAQVFLYGKETERSARLEMTLEAPDVDRATAVLENVAGELIEGPSGQEAVGKVGHIERMVGWQWHFPKDTPAEVRERFAGEEYRHRMLTEWGNLPCAFLPGKTHREAAASDDAEQRRIVQATILDIEVNSGPTASNFDFNELRANVGLPSLTLLEPFRVDIDHISLLKLHRLPADLLPDEQLLGAFSLASLTRADRAAERLGTALLSRDSITPATKQKVLLNLARIHVTSRRSIEHLARGKELAVAAGQSPAFWLLEELTVELTYGYSGAERIGNLMSEISEHRREPGVSQRFTELMVRFGFISENELHARAAPPPKFSIEGLELRADSPTPEIDLAAAGTGTETKSGLWLPGMD